MNGVAFFTDNSSISYTAIYVVMGVTAGLFCSLMTSKFYNQKVTPVLATATLSLITAILCSRIVYWYCCPEQFDGFVSAILSLGDGGYSLTGAIIGVLLAAVAVRLVHISNDLPTLLDCLAPGSALCIAVGRMGGFFSNDDKGNYIFTDSRFQRLPFAVLVQDSVTESAEWRFASFFWESLAGYAIFFLLLFFVLQPLKKDNRCKGDIFMAFLSLFGATQATLESTRYDALHMRSNGFVSMMQLTALIMLLIPLVYYSIKNIRTEKNSKTIIIPGSVSLLCISGAGAAEYFIQRKAAHAIMIYPAQFAMLFAVCIITLLLYMRTCRAKKQNI